MWDPTSVIVLAGGVYLFYVVAGEDMIYTVRKSIHCNLVCKLLDDNADSPEYVYRVLRTMNMLGLFYPQYLYSNRGQDWFDNSPIAKAINKSAANIIDLFGGSGASDDLGKYKKYSSDNLREMVDVFDSQPYSEELWNTRRAVFYGLIRFGCKECPVKGEEPLPNEGSAEYCKVAEGDPKCKSA